VRAAVCRAFGEPLVIEEIEIEAPRRGELRVEIAACAICQSDIHYVQGAWGGELPAVYGHEAAGVVVEIGAGVEGFAPGDHVVVTLIRACGACEACARGEEVLCGTTFPLDERSPLNARDGSPIVQGLRTGAFAEQVVVDASQAVVVPASIPFDRAALLACGVITGFGAAVNTARVEPGSSVVVVGTGGVGLNAVQGAAIAGAATIIAVDPAPAKRDASIVFGATHTVNPSADDIARVVAGLTGGRGVDTVIVTVGAPQPIEHSPSLLRRGGTMVIVGMPPSGVTASIDPGAVANEGHRIVGSKMGAARIAADIPYLVSLYRDGRLRLDELISDRGPLDRINELLAGASNGASIRNVIVF
jgi:S-(hydroxymethyl)glutathione dehydrogenase / alcohol dehydrogenase